jgi:hypothetical protein
VTIISLNLVTPSFGGVSDKYGFPPNKALSIAMVPPGANKSLKHIYNKLELKYSLAMTKIYL